MDDTQGHSHAHYTPAVSVEQSFPIASGKSAVLVQTAIKTIRDSVRNVVPSDFAWWIEIDDEVGFAVRWIWTGHPGVSYVGRLLDSDASIACRMLLSVNWREEVDRSIQSVEAFERVALKAAQENRKLKLTGSNLPPISLPDPGPFSVGGKRQEASAAFVSGLHERRRRRAIAALLTPTQRELQNDFRARSRKPY